MDSTTHVDTPAMTIGELQDLSFAGARPTTHTSYPPERRLTPEQLEAYLDRRSYAVIGSARPDGRPHASMSAFVRHGTTFWLPTMTKTVRARNVAHQPWLTLVVPEAEDEQHIAVLVEGPATTLGLDETPTHILGSYGGDWVTAWIRVDASRVLSYAAEDAAI
ncbi:pyridoxamine 5'-phosphate oxidase family protein [Pseudactinotalea terrae]|uniref:pyridoxamine 5'-phosphate oxidase family protein n=1 Tax=Pseudactinotalea terrae TaxID=1743262 RepID=UPI0012E255FC|nr:pyridoxamine 5'-phosphate oxidase family protein [Pseudactinotalea terrae]